MTSRCSKLIICLGLFVLSGFIVAAQPVPQKKNSTASPDSAGKELLELGRRARAYWDKGDYTNALPLFERILEISEKDLGKDSAELPRQLILLSTMYSAQGNTDKALSYLKRSLEITEKAVGMKDYEAAMTVALMNVGSIHKMRGDHAQATAALERCLTIQERFFGVAYTKKPFLNGQTALQSRSGLRVVPSHFVDRAHIHQGHSHSCFVILHADRLLRDLQAALQVRQGFVRVPLG